VLSKEDHDRLKVFQEAEKGHITQREAGRQLGIGERWVGKLLARKRKEGDRGVVHRRRGRPSNRRVGEKEQQRAVKLVGGQVPGFWSDAGGGVFSGKASGAGE
jgi:Helix-turn-helix domain